jgi:hypothetical protein
LNRGGITGIALGKANRVICHCEDQKTSMRTKEAQDGEVRADVPRRGNQEVGRGKGPNASDHHNKDLSSQPSTSLGELEALNAEFTRRQEAGWSLWRTRSAGDNGVLITFRYPSRWLPAVEPVAPGLSPPAEGKTDEPQNEQHDRHDP